MEAVEKGYKIAAKSGNNKTVVSIGALNIGTGVTVIAGPCSVESESQINEAAKAVKNGGADILRGGVYKPRTSPYSYQGMGEIGLKLLREAADKNKMITVTEVLDTRDLDIVCRYSDIIQIGSRNMQNYPLLTEAGKCGKPVLLKRGMAATVDEWLCSAEYILVEGNKNVILCERGIRTFESVTRNTLDISAVAALKTLTHLPVIVDPSHATGHTEYVSSMCLSAIMAGADGLEIEVHPNPKQAKSDSYQQYPACEFSKLMEKIKKTAAFRETLKEQ